MTKLLVNRLENNQIRKQRQMKTIHTKKMSDIYEWWREQETYEYDIETDYLYMPDIPSRTSIVLSLDS